MPNSDALVTQINKATDWTKTRLNNIDIFDEHFQLEAKTNPFYAIGPIFYLVWFLVMATGLLLIMFYVPTKAGAFDSILNIQHHVPFGNILRGVHKYGADAMIIAATIRLYRMFLAADYKPAREFNIAIALVTLLLAMYSGLTGYLLIWNQRAFWATKVFATFPTYMDQFPVMGDFYLPLVKSIHMGWNTAEFLLGAGGAITQETITRFFSLHIAFSLIPLIFVELYFYNTGYKRIPLSWLKRSVVIAQLVAVAILMPAALGHRSNPDVTPLPILSDWYFLGLYQMYKYLEPVVATEITMVIPLSVVLLPFIDVWLTGPEKDISKRPVIFLTSLMGFLNWIVFSVLIVINIANIHSDPPWWRDGLWMMVDVGCALQLVVYTQYTDVRQKIAAAKGCLTMGIVMGIQSILALVYFFMARTEMFLSPLTQAWTYMTFRPFMANGASAAESLVGQLVGLKTNPPYWFYQELIARGNNPDDKILRQLADLCNNTKSIFDPIFSAIPTFLPDYGWLLGKMQAANIPMSKLDDVMTHPALYNLPPVQELHYKGMLDFMVSNRWCFDYVTFVGRIGGQIKPYPVDVPMVDLGWMLMAPTVALVSFYMWSKYRKLTVPAAPGAAPAVKTPAPTA